MYRFRPYTQLHAIYKIQFNIKNHQTSKTEISWVIYGKNGNKLIRVKVEFFLQGEDSVILTKRESVKSYIATK